MHARQKEILERMFSAYEEKIKRYRKWKPSERVMAMAEARELVDQLTGSPEDRLEMFVGEDGQWYWHRKAAGNWEVISQGQGFESKLGCEYGARRANPDFQHGPIHVVETLLPEEPDADEKVALADVAEPSDRPNVGTAEVEQPYGGVHPVDPKAMSGFPSREDSDPKGKPKGS